MNTTLIPCIFTCFAFVNETGGGSNDKEDAWEVSVSVRLSGLIHALTN